MTPIIIITHGTLAESFLESIQMIYGATQDIYAFNFTKNMDLTVLEEQVKSLINSFNTKDILIFTDMLGGSAFNTAMKMQINTNAYIVAGINLMMLLDIVSIRDNLDFLSLQQHIDKNKEKYISIFKKKVN